LREGIEADDLDKADKGIGTIHDESDEVDANMVVLSMFGTKLLQFLGVEEWSRPAQDEVIG
jgi:hypothetical protein